MSIWCPWEPVGHEEGEPMRGGEVRTYAAGFSNHYPDLTEENELPASVGINSVAPWCVPGHDEDCERCGSVHDYPEVGEWVRLTLFAEETIVRLGDTRRDGPVCQSVVMDEAAARQLAADLLAWADMPKVRTA